MTRALSSRNYTTSFIKQFSTTIDRIYNKPNHILQTGNKHTYLFSIHLCVVKYDLMTRNMIEQYFVDNKIYCILFI